MMMGVFGWIGGRWKVGGGFFVGRIWLEDWDEIFY